MAYKVTKKSSKNRERCGKPRTAEKAKKRNMHEKSGQTKAHCQGLPAQACFVRILQTFPRFFPVLMVEVNHPDNGDCGNKCRHDDSSHITLPPFFLLQAIDLRLMLIQWKQIQ